MSKHPTEPGATLNQYDTNKCPYCEGDDVDQQGHYEDDERRTVYMVCNSCSKKWNELWAYVNSEVPFE